MAVVFVTGGWLAAVSELGVPGPPFESEWVGLLALVPVLAAYALAVWAADRWAGRIGCPNCRAVVTDATRLTVDRCCGRCRTPMLTAPDPGDPPAEVRPFAEVEAAVKRVVNRDSWTGFGCMIACGLAVMGGQALTEEQLVPGWLAVGAVGLAVTAIGMTYFADCRRALRRNPAARCPHCRSLLHAVGALQRTGRCGYCGRIAVSDPPAGVAAVGPTG